jgi:hypothetical protein
MVKRSDPAIMRSLAGSETDRLFADRGVLVGYVELNVQDPAFFGRWKALTVK